MSVIVYTSKTCGPCASIKRYLDHKQIDYSARDIEHHKWADQVQKLTGQLIVPVTVIDGTPVTGLNYSRIAELLK